MIPRSRFDFSRPPPSRSLRLYTVLGVALLTTALIAGGGPVTAVAGKSGQVYEVRAEREVWRAVGPALAVRFHTSGVSRSAAAAEAADLLPHFAAQADSAELRFLLLRAYRPVWRIGDLGVYRGWNFRYECGEEGWKASSYW
jgi:hypothetical protein